MPGSHATPRGRRFWLRLPHGNEELPYGEQMVIGRSPQSDIVLAGDAFVSSMHAELTAATTQVLLRDLDSANGTYVDGHRVDGSHTLLGGETVRVGRTEIGVIASDDQRRLVAGARTLADFGAVQAPAAAPAADIFLVAGKIAKRHLADGDGAVSAPYVAACLELLLAEARETGGLDARLSMRAVALAGRLGKVTGDARWARYADDLAEAGDGLADRTGQFATVKPDRS